MGETYPTRKPCQSRQLLFRPTAVTTSAPSALNKLAAKTDQSPVQSRNHSNTWFTK